MTESLLPPFFRIGPERPVSPVILSVPHAGRDYGAHLLNAARLRKELLETLEDRLVDRLIWRATALGMTAFVAEHKITPIVDRVFPLAETEAALRYLESGAQFGKIVLVV